LIYYRSGFTPNSTTSVVEPWNKQIISATPVQLTTSGDIRACVGDSLSIELDLDIGTDVYVDNVIVTIIFPKELIVTSIGTQFTVLRAPTIGRGDSSQNILSMSISDIYGSDSFGIFLKLNFKLIIFSYHTFCNRCSS
jgi:hypothetical protein